MRWRGGDPTDHTPPHAGPGRSAGDTETKKPRILASVMRYADHSRSYDGNTIPTGYFKPLSRAGLSKPWLYSVGRRVCSNLDVVVIKAMQRRRRKKGKKIRVQHQTNQLDLLHVWLAYMYVYPAWGIRPTYRSSFDRRCARRRGSGRSRGSTSRQKVTRR